MIDASSTTTTPAQHAVTEHLRLLTAGDIDGWVELFADNGLLTFPFAPAGMPTEVQGREALLAHMRNFPETFDVQSTPVTFVGTDDPNVTVAEFGLTGRAIPTGKPYEQRCISIVRTDTDGRIVRYDDYWNGLVAIEALTPDGDAAGGSDGVADSFGA